MADLTKLTTDQLLRIADELRLEVYEGNSGWCVLRVVDTFNCIREWLSHSYLSENLAIKDAIKKLTEEELTDSPAYIEAMKDV